MIMICEYCHKEHDGSYGSGRFCSKTCASKYTSSMRKSTKICKCIDCGKEVEVKREVPSKKFLCDDCKAKKFILYEDKKTSKKIIKKSRCTVCGNIITFENGNRCSNSFCQQHNIRQFKNLFWFGFDRSTIGTPRVEEEFYRIRGILYDLYWNKKMSGKEIGEYFHYPNKHSIIQGTFKTLGIKIRSLSQATSNAFEKGKLNQNQEKHFKTQNHISWNNKSFYLRSSYEIDFANELDSKKIDYDVEFLRIKYFDSKKNKYRIAIPDFYIKNKNLIVEIKSVWTLDYQTMLDKEKAYKDFGYNFKIIFEHQEYNSVNEINIDKYHKNIETERLEKYRTYKQKDGFNWISKDGIVKRCNKKETQKFISDGWHIGRK